IGEFARAYADGYRLQDRLRAVDAACFKPGRPRTARLGITERYQAASLAGDLRVDPKQQRRLTLCLVQELGAVDYDRRARKMVADLDSFLKKHPDSFNPRERAILAYWRLDSALPNPNLSGVFGLASPPKLDFSALRENARRFADVLPTLEESAANQFF